VQKQQQTEYKKGLILKKLILAFTLLLTPFFCSSQAVTSIFFDGTVPVVPPSKTTTTLVDCKVGGTITITGRVTDTEHMARKCHTVWLREAKKSSDFCGNASWETAVKMNYDFSTYNNCDNEDTIRRISGVYNYPTLIEYLESEGCPPDTAPQNTFGAIDIGSTKVGACANPSEIPLFDDCKINKTSEFLSTTVTSQQVCHEKPNGSTCKYNAVSSSSGEDYYALDLEGNCYSDPAPAPDGQEYDTPENSDDLCSQFGSSSLICPENPEDVCSVGSSIDGSSIKDCQQGCGEVNGVFVCIDSDIDSDGVPDYLDPDKDGDGIKNDDDLDSDGDGKDDPIDNSPSNPSAPVDIDLSGVIAKLGDVESAVDKTTKSIDDLKKSVSETSVTLNKEPTKNLKSFYKSKYDDGVDGMFTTKIEDFKQTEFYIFLDQFKPNFSGSAPDMSFCLNFGHGMNLGCHSFVLDPRIFPALKIFILVTAGFTCRKILFGG